MPVNRPGMVWDEFTRAAGVFSGGGGASYVDIPKRVFDKGQVTVLRGNSMRMLNAEFTIGASPADGKKTRITITPADATAPLADGDVIAVQRPA